MPQVHLLDYVAGNVRSLVNAIEKLGWTVQWITSPDQIPDAETLILPGVGHFGHCVSQFNTASYTQAIINHIKSGKPFFGICVGLQALFEGSDEDLNTPGFGIIKGHLKKFDEKTKSVPHIGWNSATTADESQSLYGLNPASKYYYVHSYAVPYVQGNLESQGWTVATGQYGSETFVGLVSKDNVLATQFHPEKSGAAGLRLIKAFLQGRKLSPHPPNVSLSPSPFTSSTGLTHRIIACLDVRANDAGDIVVTKGDQYDVREKCETANSAGQVRNLGKPVELAQRYYEQGADEITFLNITSFRNCPVSDLPMLEILRLTSKSVFVPLTIGGGIRDTTNPDGTPVSAEQIAGLYFQSGADKVSIGSDAIAAANAYYANGSVPPGTTAIERIAAAYGSQAVVVSIDPRRAYLATLDGDDDDAAASLPPHTLAIRTAHRGPNGEPYVWFQCTAKGGREPVALDAVRLAVAVEALGAGEILLNSIDRDGGGAGFDLELVAAVKGAVRIPVIASSGAGCVEHFAQVFGETRVDAALGAGIFHRGEVSVKQVKDYLEEKKFLVRQFEDWI